ncbi:MAG: hypothetical protein U0992_02910 [Planctomycetaceae bacterium]
MSTDENAVNRSELSAADVTRAPQRRLIALVVLHFLVAAMLLLLPLGFTHGRSADGPNVAMLSAMVCLPLGLLFAFTGRGILGRRSWARRVAMWLDGSLAATSFIAALLIVLALLVNPPHGGPGFGGLAAAGAVILFAVWVAVLLVHGAVWLVALLFLRRPSVSAAFADRRPLQYSWPRIVLTCLFAAAYLGGLQLSAAWHRAETELYAIGLYEAPGSRVTATPDRANFDDAALLRASGRIRDLYWQHLNLSDTRITDDGLDCLKDLSTVEDLDLSGTQVTGAGLKHLAALPKLHELRLSETAVTDLGLADLKNLPELRGLDLSGTRITDAGLQQLATMSNLWGLNLSQTEISDVGIAHLKDLPELHDLDLSRTRVTDAGLKHVAGMPSLWRLNLSQTTITDEGLRELKGAQSLMYLFVSGTSVSDAGAAELHESLPGLRQIDRSPPVPSP